MSEKLGKSHLLQAVNRIDTFVSDDSSDDTQECMADALAALRRLQLSVQIDNAEQRAQRAQETAERQRAIADDLRIVLFDERSTQAAPQ